MESSLSCVNISIIEPISPTSSYHLSPLTLCQSYTSLLIISDHVPVSYTHLIKLKYLLKDKFSRPKARVTASLKYNSNKFYQTCDNMFDKSIYQNNIYTVRNKIGRTTFPVQRDTQHIYLPRRSMKTKLFYVSLLVYVVTLTLATF